MVKINTISEKSSSLFIDCSLILISTVNRFLKEHKHTFEKFNLNLNFIYWDITLVTTNLCGDWPQVYFVTFCHKNSTAFSVLEAVHHLKFILWWTAFVFPLFECVVNAAVWNAEVCEMLNRQTGLHGRLWCTKQWTYLEVFRQGLSLNVAIKLCHQDSKKNTLKECNMTIIALCSYCSA